MASNGNRAAIYLRVSTSDRQTTENQRMALTKVAEHQASVRALTKDRSFLSPGVQHARVAADAIDATYPATVGQALRDG